MGWIDPKIDWDIEYEPSPEDMNRMEGNSKALKEDAITISGNKTFSGNNVHSGNNNFTGTNEIQTQEYLKTNNVNNVETKEALFTGTLDGSGNAVIASGITPGKILMIRAYYYYTPTTTWGLLVNEGTFGRWGEVQAIDAVGNISILSYNPLAYNKNYRCYVKYEA